MKESIAQAFILNLILFFFVVLVLLLFGSINYSKAYKVKNRIITIIEKYGDYNAAAKAEIEENLANAGYTVANRQEVNKCKDLLDTKKNTGAVLVYPTEADNNYKHYHYCVFRYDGDTKPGKDGGTVSKESNSRYYQVVAYMKFDIPVFGGFLEFPVRGETKVMYDFLNS